MLQHFMLVLCSPRMDHVTTFCSGLIEYDNAVIQISRNTTHRHLLCIFNVLFELMFLVYL